jgi:Transposase
LAKSPHTLRKSVRRSVGQKPDYRQARLLRARRERASHRSSEKRDELASPHRCSPTLGAKLFVMPFCLIGMEACVGAHHLSRRLEAMGHDARLMPAKYVRPYSNGQKNDFRDAEAIAEAVQRPTMKFVATKTADQLDLQGLHRVRERLVRGRASHGTGNSRWDGHEVD